MRVLVTGGAGFIGSHVCDLLIENGYQVKVVDNMEGGRMENLNQVEGHPNFKFVEADIRNFSQIEPHFANIDWVIHLAGIADIVPSIENPGAYFSTNLQGTMNVLECSRKHAIKRFVYAASSSCYGIPDQYPTPEIAAVRPQYPYAMSKYMGEQLVVHWNAIYQLPCVSLRLFNVYGPRVRTNGAYGAVFGVFLAQKANNKPYTVVGNGQQTRDFTYVTDVAGAFLRAAESKLDGEIMNVGSGNHYSINRLVEHLGGDVVYVPKRPGEPDCTFADVRKITTLLGWSPKVDFETGIGNMVENLKQWQSAPLWDPDSIQQATQTWFKYMERKDHENNFAERTM
ncbi:MAG: SDR family oxidoreductase [Gammaproteobacteria bacterium]|nr:SDR family oxidoreductase [Gammaproteobacteria bacterium]